MYYRRLPNTDRARLKAISLLVEKIEQSDRYDVISLHQMRVIKELGDAFRGLIEERESIEEEMRERNREKKTLFRKLKLSISHYFQVLNFAIVRGEIEKESREYFNLDVNCGTVPLLSSDSAVMVWGATVLKGEGERIGNSEMAISHPNIKVIKELFEATKTSKEGVDEIKGKDKELRSVIAKERIKVDRCIRKAWDDVEYCFEDQSKQESREFCQEFGVVYVKS